MCQQLPSAPRMCQCHTSLWSDITKFLKNPPAPGLSRGTWRPVLLLLCATSRAFWLLHHQACGNCSGENKSQPIKTNGPKGSWQGAILFSVTVVAFVVCPLVLQLQFSKHHAHSYCHTSACAIPSAWDALNWLVYQAIHLSLLSTNTLSSLKSPLTSPVMLRYCVPITRYIFEKQAFFGVCLHTSD